MYNNVLQLHVRFNNLDTIQKTPVTKKLKILRLFFLNSLYEVMLQLNQFMSAIVLVLKLKLHASQILYKFTGSGHTGQKRKTSKQFLTLNIIGMSRNQDLLIYIIFLRSFTRISTINEGSRDSRRNAH